MPERNIRYYKNLPADWMPDGWRYRIELIPVAAESYLSETLEELPDDFIEKLPAPDCKSDAVPAAFWDGGVASVEVNLRSVHGNPLFDYLTDDGVILDYNLNASTVWLFLTDGGNETLGYEDFEVVFCGVQRDYVGNEISAEGRDGGTIKIDLVEIGKVVFESIPVAESGKPPWVAGTERTYYTLEDYVRSRVATMGGPLDVYTPRYRDRAFELLYVDGDDNLYGIMRRERYGTQEYVFVRWSDVIDAWEALAGQLLRKLLRDNVSGVTMRYLPTRAFGCGAVTDNVTLYEQGYTDDAGAGPAVQPDALYIMAWVREKKDGIEWDDHRIFDGGAIWGDNAAAKEYTNLWDWYRDLTECCLARGAFAYGRDGGAVTLFVNSTTIYDSTHDSGPGFDVGAYTLDAVNLKRGGTAGRISSAVGNIPDPIGKSKSEFKRAVGSTPQSLGDWNTQLALHTNPISPEDADHYWVSMPSNRFAQDTGADTDFTVSGSKAIVGTSAANLQAFYYFGIPEFYSGSAGSIAIRCHHAPAFNMPGLTADYTLPEGVTLQLPTWDSLGYGAVPTNHSSQFFADPWLKTLRASLIEIGRKGWPAHVAFIAARIWGRPELRQTRVAVRRSELHFANGGLLQVVRFHPSDVYDIVSNTKPNAVLIGLKQNIGTGSDEVTFCNYWGDA